MDEDFLKPLMTEKCRKEGTTFHEMVAEEVLEISVSLEILYAPAYTHENLTRYYNEALSGNRFPLEVYRVYRTQRAGRYYNGLVLWSKRECKIVATATEGSKQSLRIHWRSLQDKLQTLRTFLKWYDDILEETWRSICPTRTTTDYEHLKVIKDMIEMPFEEEHLDSKTVVIIGDDVVHPKNKEST